MSNPCIGCGTDTGPALEPWCEACVAKAAARIGLIPKVLATTQIFDSMVVCGTKIRSGDHVSLTGRCHSLGGEHVSLSGVVDTMCANEDTGRRPEFKVWPDDTVGNGKLWFFVTDVESLEMLRSAWLEPIKSPAQRLIEAIYVVREVSANEVPASRASWLEVADAVDEYDHGLITASVVRQSLQKLVLRHAANGLSMRHVRAVRIALDAVEDLRVLASSPLTKTTSAVMILARRSVDDALRDVVDQTA